MAASLRSLIVKIGADDKDIQQSLVRIGDQSKALAKTLSSVGGQPLGQAAQKSLDELINKQRQTAEGALKTAAGLDRIGGVSALTSTQLASMNKSLQDGISAFKALGQQVPPELQKVADAVQKATSPKDDPWAKLAKSMASVGATAKTIGTGLSVGITAPLLAIGGVATKAAVDFESSFAGVRKTVDGVVDSFGKLTPAGERLQQQFRDLAKTIPVSVVELNKIGESAGQLGIRQEDIIGFTKQMAILGVTTNLTSDQAATATARIQNIFGAAGKDTDRFASTLVALGNAGASTEADIIEMSLRIAGAGKIAGLAQADVLGIANALSSLGVEADAGGTAVQKVLLAMTKSVASGGSQLEAFAKVAGQSAGQFAAAFRGDAAGAFASFVEGLGRAGTGAIQALDDIGLSDQRLIRSFLSLAGSGNLLRESIDLGSKAWVDNTAATKEAEQRFQTFASQMQLLKNNANDVAITLGTAMLPTFKDIINLAKPAVGALASLADEFAKSSTATREFVLVAGGLAALSGPMLFLFGTMIEGASKLGPLMKVLSASTTLFGASLTVLQGLTVVGLLLTLVGALVQVATAIKNLYSAWQAGQSMWSFFTAKDDNTFARRWLGLSDSLDQTRKNLKPLGDIELPAAAKSLERVGAAAKTSVDGLDKLTSANSAVSAATAALTGAQQAAIARGFELGRTAKQIAKDLGLSAEAITAFHKAETAAAAANKVALNYALAQGKEYQKLLETIHKLEANRGPIAPLGGAFDLAKPSADLKEIQKDLTAISKIELGSTLIGPLGGAIALVKPSMKDLVKTAGGLADVFKGIPDLLIQAFTGGGGVLGAVKALGVQLGENLVKSLQAAVKKSVASGGIGLNSSTLGLAAGAGAGTGIGALAGGASGGQAIGAVGGATLGVVSGALATHTALVATLALGAATFGVGAAAVVAYIAVKKLLNDPEKKINPLRQGFIDSAGGLEALNRQAKAAGTTLDQLLDAKNPQQYKAAIDALSASFQFQSDAMDSLQAVTQKYGFTLEELGPALAKQELDKKATELYQDFQVLTTAGVDANAIINRMGDSINAFVNSAIATGTEVPAAMKPMLERMIEMGKLTDSSGNAFGSLANTGLTFTETMSEGFTRVVDSVKKLTDAIARGLGLAIDDTDDALNSLPRRIDIDLHYNDPGIPDFQGAGGGSTGGRVTRNGIRPFSNVLAFPGSPNSQDTVPAWLKPGEVVLTEAQQQAVASPGGQGGTVVDLSSVLNAINAQRRESAARDADQPHRIAKYVKAAVETARRTG